MAFLVLEDISVPRIMNPITPTLCWLWGQLTIGRGEEMRAQVQRPKDRGVDTGVEEALTAALTSVIWRPRRSTIDKCALNMRRGGKWLWIFAIYNLWNKREIGVSIRRSEVYRPRRKLHLCSNIKGFLPRITRKPISIATEHMESPIKFNSP